jgi:hypothetical protein
MTWSNFSALAYTLVEALRRLGLKDTDWAEALPILAQPSSLHFLLKKQLLRTLVIL